MSHRPVPPASARLRRSLLAVPASSMKMMQKAVGTDADAVFLDLEDAVAAPEKEAARQLAITALQELDWRGSGKTISLRVNGLDTVWTVADLVEVVGAAGAHLDTIIIPKLGGPEDLYAVDTIVTQLAGAGGFAPPALEGLIETAAGVSNLEAIARYNNDMGSQRLEALHFGAGDYAASVSARTVEIGGLNPDYPGDQFHFAVSRIVAAAKRASAIAMNGKWAIHPSQISLANDEFSPTSEEVSRARAILAALDEAAAEGRGAVRFEGKMIDAANERMVRAILAADALINDRK